MQSQGRALLYIAVFGIGSIAGMAVLSAAMAGPLQLSMKWFGAGHQVGTGLIGGLSFALGVALIYRNAMMIH